MQLRIFVQGLSSFDYKLCCEWDHCTSLRGENNGCFNVLSKCLCLFYMIIGNSNRSRWYFSVLVCAEDTVVHVERVKTGTDQTVPLSHNCFLQERSWKLKNKFIHEFHWRSSWVCLFFIRYFLSYPIIDWFSFWLSSMSISLFSTDPFSLTCILLSLGPFPICTLKTSSNWIRSQTESVLNQDSWRSTSVPTS